MHGAADFDPMADFSGSWRCTSVEGDMGELMKKLGIGFMKRQAAKTVGYGVGKQQQVRRPTRQCGRCTR